MVLTPAEGQGTCPHEDSDLRLRFKACNDHDCEPLGLLHEVVTLPAGDGDEGELLLDLVLLVASGLEHDKHLSGDLIETRLQVRGRGSVVHLVDADDHLLDAEQVDETGVLTGLTLDLTSGTVALGDSLLEATLIGGDHEKSDIGLAGTGNHVLDEVTVARGIDDGVVVLLGEELLGRARDGHTTLTLILLGIEVEGERERRLAELGGLLLELLHLSFRDTSKLEKQVTSGGRLTSIDVSAHDE